MNIFHWIRRLINSVFCSFITLLLNSFRFHITCLTSFFIYLFFLINSLLIILNNNFWLLFWRKDPNDYTFQEVKDIPEDSNDHDG